MNDVRVFREANGWQLCDICRMAFPIGYSHICGEPSATIPMQFSWVSESNKREAFVRVVDALTEAQKHICQNGCGRVGDNHCTRCQQMDAVLVEAMGVMEAWDE
jgi:hypothetical protein